MNYNMLLKFNLNISNMSFPANKNAQYFIYIKNFQK